jgi:predicted RecB family nuclease
MRLTGSELVLSATDLSNFLGCHHRTGLEIAAARGDRQRPFRHDPLLDLLRKLGADHEAAHLRALESNGLEVLQLAGVGGRDERIARTLDAMRAGAPVIAQGALGDDRWFGYPDVLQRVEQPSALGSWSYEVADTKLARETRGGTILQLSLYSELLAAAQGLRPEYYHVVTPDPANPVHSFRVDDFAAYFRLVCGQMIDTVGHDYQAILAANYPEPVEHCDVCPWDPECRAKRHDDDHLSLVAGITRLQRRELESRSVATLSALASLPVPLAFKPRRGAVETYLRVREQARVQLESRGRTPPLHELREITKDEGLGRLPVPAPGDLFLDLEGDQFAAEGGREYLFGVAQLGPGGQPAYRSWWAFDEQQERDAFEQVMDQIMAAWRHDPSMHVYHYAPYEPSAFKRLMGRYATREEELDRLLRGGRFVDLYAVVRQAMWVGVESYSIKRLEPVYAFARQVDLADANRSLRAMEQALWLGVANALPREARDVVERYNRDDCVSTLHLREWLERAREDAVTGGAEVPRPAAPGDAASEDVTARDARVTELRARLLADVSETPSERTEEQHARFILAYLLDWHRREDKASWWEYFRLRELPDEDLFDEPQAVAGMEFVERVEVVRNKKSGRPTGSVIDRYAYPLQEMEIRGGAGLHLLTRAHASEDDDGAGVVRPGSTKFGDVIRVNRGTRTLDVRKGAAQAGNHPSAVFAHTHFSPEVIEGAIFRLGEAVAGDGSIDAGPPSAARDLLLASPPRLRSGIFAQRANERATAFAERLVGDLDRTVLAIQGPPGSGKTYAGARMICALVKDGKRVGVTANSHKVIDHLLEEVLTQAASEGIVVRPAHRRSEDEDDDANGTRSDPAVAVVSNNGEALRMLQSGEADVLGGTAWLWARQEFANAVHVLFIEEAAQMSLANAVAVSQACESLVLLGDPQQLAQPIKGTHPDGAGASALQHMLGDHKTMPPDRGLFLPVTWRLPPTICAYTSELFYESRLESKAGLEHQQLTGSADLDGAGLWLAPVEHDGNRNFSQEEIDVVAGLVRRLTAPGVLWVNEKGGTAQLQGNDILVVAPYNAHVNRLVEALAGTGARAGTVDLFQGREAPVVIYSMATSRPEDAPRGMEFLYSLNRLNVATSRARCAAILVASPRLFEPDCRTPRQMKLANALCRFRELARRVPVLPFAGGA